MRSLRHYGTKALSFSTTKGTKKGDSSRVLWAPAKRGNDIMKSKTKGLFSVILASDRSKIPVELKKMTKMRYF